MISRTTYPVPPSLARALDELTSSSSSRFASLMEDNDHHHQQQTATATAVLQKGLSYILENAIHALDRWYFATSPDVRSELSHRTCLRLSSDPSNASITITDLGIGMTRADLINLLGVGRPFPPNALSSTNSSEGDDDSSIKSTASNSSRSSSTSRLDRIWNRKRIRQQQQQQNVSRTVDASGRGKDRSRGRGVGGFSSISSRSTISTSTIDEEEHVIPKEDENDHVVMESTLSKEWLGGFYAAVASLAVGVRVATKVRTIIKICLLLCSHDDALIDTGEIVILFSRVSCFYLFYKSTVQI